ncbi:MAG: magnesium and cobalt transport protein CorA [Acidimicrobiia bacterium]|nr:magnesium and cobalt transport protein CorA [Acidimicrobiia bacterium]
MLAQGRPAYYVADVYIDAALYRKGRRLEGPFELEGAAEQCQDPDTFCWIGLYEPTKEEIASVSSEFGLHELAVEDAIHAHQRPKIDVYGSTLLVVLKPARYVDPVEVIELGEILLFVDIDFLIAVRHGEASKLVAVRRSLEEQPEELALGPGAVLQAIFDRVVDDYAHVLDGLDTDITELEVDVFSDDTTTPTQRIYKLKREVLQFEQATQPLVEPLLYLAMGKYEVIPTDLIHYFADVHDHLVRVVNRVSGYRDLLNSILEANLTQVSVRQNNDMRKISAWVAIAAVPTLLAGIWGMNFEHMPELNSNWGYPMALAVMVSVCTGLYRKFKKSGWL